WPRAYDTLAAAYLSAVSYLPLNLEASANSVTFRATLSFERRK
ncbi:unnamed protein product, partial [marine sediment metagenome]